MPETPQQATALIDLLNGQAKIDITLPPAAVTPCTAPSLPRNPKPLWSLLPEKHRDFLEQVTGSIALDDPVHHHTASYDPAELCGYHFHAEDAPETLKVKAATKDFFLGRAVDVIEGHGNFRGAYEFEFDLVIVLDVKAGLIFSFVWNLQD